ncbi:hypothetical protein DEJ50_30530 [Streptomyces venezuelae]|uniref:Lipoprotein n=1 Tax=Streptomyces venezuelae TaxID=54571 RepID=A0A5P2DE58_STRVZ|nr:hypothetical protein DEJ50_30530 [Streptomyces venezuelae]
MVVAVIAAATAGCSDGEPAKKAAAGAGAQVVDTVESMVATLGKASDAASAAGSAEVKMTVTTPDTGGKPTTMTGTYSWGNGLAMQAEVPAADLQMQDLVSDGTITYRMVQGAYYYEVDAAPSGPFKGKTWLKVDASAVLGEKGVASLEGSQNDPTAGLKMVKYAAGVTKVGKENVLGKEAVHYRATIPKDKLGESGAAFTALGGGTELVTDVWVDDQNMPVRLNQTIGAMTVHTDFYSFGAAKDIPVPPASETADMTEAFKEANGRKV